MLASLHPRERGAIVLLLLVALATALAVAAPQATASNAAIVIPFEKHFVDEVVYADKPANYYVGTAGDDGTIEMWVYDSHTTGGVQHFTATLKLSMDDKSLTAVLDGRFNFSTFRVVLNGRVTEGWLAGAEVHEESVLVGFAPLTFAGTIRLMPGSAD